MADGTTTRNKSHSVRWYEREYDVPRMELYAALKRRELPGYRFTANGTWRIPEQEFLAWRERFKFGPPADQHRDRIVERRLQHEARADG